ncbi:MAG: thermonuclease family protein [Cytophagaceae bacterium]|nr:thermonuclease family protein [Cytophagaceae bacterium]
MKTTLLIILMLFSLNSFCQIKARVIRVKDGDTFVALWKGQTIDCRISNIDAPELKQNFGMSSRDSLSKLVLGKMVMLSDIKKDLYGRMLVNVRIENVRLDSLIIRNGWAWHYANYSKDTILKDCMTLACSEGAGLWRCGKSKVCPPWLYRKYKHHNRMRYCKGC